MEQYRNTFSFFADLSTRSRQSSSRKDDFAEPTFYTNQRYSEIVNKPKTTYDKIKKVIQDKKSTLGDLPYQTQSIRRLDGPFDIEEPKRKVIKVKVKKPVMKDENEEVLSRRTYNEQPAWRLPIEPLEDKPRYTAPSYSTQDKTFSSFSSQEKSYKAPSYSSKDKVYNAPSYSQSKYETEKPKIWPAQPKYVETVPFGGFTGPKFNYDKTFDMPKAEEFEDYEKKPRISRPKTFEFPEPKFNYDMPEVEERPKIEERPRYEARPVNFELPRSVERPKPTEMPKYAPYKEPKFNYEKSYEKPKYETSTTPYYR